MSTPPRESGRDVLSRSLRALRKTAGLSQVQAAALAGITQSRLSRAESGKFILRPDETETYALALGAPRAERDRLAALARDVQAGSLDSRIIMQRGAHHFQERVERIENSSALIRSFHPAIVLGILQTPAYMRAVLSPPSRPNPHADDTAAVRVRRQAALRDSRREWVLIQSEGSLRWQAANPQLMIEQVEHLIEVSYLPNVRVGLVDWRTPADVFPLHGFHLYDQRAVQVGTETATALITEQRDVSAYGGLFVDLEKLARFDDEGRDSLTRIAGEYRGLEMQR